MRPNFVTPKTVKKRYTCQQNWPICAEGSLFLAKLADSSLTVDEKGYLLTYVQFIADSANGQFRTVTFEYDRTLVTRDIQAVDIEFGCCADSCVEAILGWFDVIKAQVEQLETNSGGGGSPSEDRYIASASIVDGAGDSKKLRLTFNTGSPSYVEVTLPSEVSGSPNPYPNAISISGGKIRVTLSDATYVETDFPDIPAGIEGVELDGSTLIITLSEGDPLEVDLSALPGLSGDGGGVVPVTNANDTEAEVEGDYTSEQVAAGLIVLWTDASGAARVSIANEDGWVHGTAQTSGVCGVAKEFDPSAVQNLTTTYADIDGSSVTYTPKYSNSRIVYEFSCHVAGRTSSYSGMGHFQFVSGGNVVAKSKVTQLAEWAADSADEVFHYRFSLPSWGKTARTLKLMGRAYSSNVSLKVHGSRYMDGATSESLFKATLTVLEFLPTT